MILEKAKKKKQLLENIANTTTLAKITLTSSFINFTRRYKQKINNTNLNAAKKLGLTRLKRY